MSNCRCPSCGSTFNAATAKTVIAYKMNPRLRQYVVERCGGRDDATDEQLLALLESTDVDVDDFASFMADEN